MEHPSDPAFVNVGFNIADIRLLHNAVSFYLTDRPVSGARPAHQQEPTKHVEAMKRVLSSVLMEYTYRKQTAEDINNNQKKVMTISMDDLMDAIVANQSPSQVSDAIKDLLYSKTANKVDALKPEIANSLFGNQVPEVEDEVEVNDAPEATTETEEDE